MKNREIEQMLLNYPTVKNTEALLDDQEMMLIRALAKRLNSRRMPVEIGKEDDYEFGISTFWALIEITALGRSAPKHCKRVDDIAYPVYWSLYCRMVPTEVILDTFLPSVSKAMKSQNDVPRKMWDAVHSVLKGVPALVSESLLKFDAEEEGLNDFLRKNLVSQYSNNNQAKPVVAFKWSWKKFSRVEISTPAPIVDYSVQKKAEFASYSIQFSAEVEGGTKVWY